MSQKYFWQIYAREETTGLCEGAPEVYKRGPAKFWMEYWSSQEQVQVTDAEKILPVDVSDRCLLRTGHFPLEYYRQFPELSDWHTGTRYLGPETPGHDVGMNLVYRVAFRPNDGQIYLPVCIRIFYGGCTREKNWPLLAWESFPLYFYLKNKKV